MRITKELEPAGGGGVRGGSAENLMLGSTGPALCWLLQGQASSLSPLLAFGGQWGNLITVVA